MLSDQHFYHRITRKLVVGFGTLFNNMKLVRYDKTNTTEIERITVPLAYANKEKYYKRITEDPNLAKEVQVTLPRMSFELASITYDPLRKISQQIPMFGANTASSTRIKEVKSTPYNFEFNLNVFVRNTEDGTQIVEQILPYFSPDYTLTLDLVGINNLKVDVPIILQSINMEVTNDVGSGADDTRMTVWTLNFMAKAYLYGPINNPKIIRKVTANTYYANELDPSAKVVYMGTGTGDYKLGELVYSGRTLSSANATAFVKGWNAVSNVLTIIDTSGYLKAGQELKGAVTGATYNVVSYGTENYQMTNLTVVPDPLTANIGDDFGFTETLIEY